MRVSVIQMAYDNARTPAERRVEAARRVRGCAGSDLVVLPELWPHGAFGPDGWEDVAEAADGPTAQAMSAAAAAAGVTLHAGSMVERADGDRLYNTAVVFGPDGGRLAAYRKMHLFGAIGREAELMTPGEGPVWFEVPWGQRVGLATCYDVRFPELFRALSAAPPSVETIVMCAAFPAARIEPWRLLVQARAVENQCLVVACNAAGVDARERMGGHSLVVAADGEILVEGGEGDETLTLEVDAGRSAAVRAAFPVLRDRRL